MENEELKKENEKLKEIVALKSDLISMTAHQLRNSATAQKWILKMLMDQDVGATNKEQETLLQKAYESNERAIEMIGEFLSANRSEDATVTYRFEEADVIKLLEAVISDLDAVAFKQGIELSFEKPSEKIPYLKIDAAKTRIVFQNLIDNAIKYSDKGAKISISAKRAGDTVEFEVQDQGIGIKEEDRPKIFNKFFRGENAKKKKEIGTGLGLFNTKAIIEKQGGKIWFESSEGKGTAFYFTLPI